MLRAPLTVVTMSGEYHSKLFVPLESGQSTTAEATTEAPPVVKINRLPVRVVARIEGATVGIELVAKDQVPLAPILPGSVRVGLLGGVLVYQAKVSYIGDLARRVDASQVVPAQRARFLPGQVRDHGVHRTARSQTSQSEPKRRQLTTGK
jgi:hypothetical protein